MEVSAYRVLAGGDGGLDALGRGGGSGDRGPEPSEGDAEGRCAALLQAEGLTEGLEVGVEGGAILLAGDIGGGGGDGGSVGLEGLLGCGDVVPF